MESIAAAINKSSNAAQILNHSEAMQQSAVCPHLEHNDLTCSAQGALKHIIIHLNDEHKWSREDIADWLDTLENQPVFYPDIRTDDEKIEDAKKEAKLCSAHATGAWVKSPPISSYNTTTPYLTYGGLNAGSTVTLQYGGSTVSGYVENIECHYSGYKECTYTVTFHSY